MDIKTIPKIGAILAAVGIWMGASMTANATLTFEDWSNVTQNGNADISGQLKMDVTVSGDYLFLNFRNLVGVASDVAEIYFDAPPPGDTDTWFDPSTPTITGQNGNTFDMDNKVAPKSPSGLGGDTWDFVVSARVDSDIQGGNGDGLNTATDYLTLRFAFAPSMTKTEEQVMQALEGGDFRVAMHVRSIGTTGGSDTYSTVPEPTSIIAAALLILPFGMSTLRALRNRRAQT